MANASTPTAANIISSLGVRGAVSRVPSGASVSVFAGFVPMLGDDGKISADFIPAGAAQMSIPPLTSVAFVDPCTTVEESLRKGSVVAPFKTLGEAAGYFDFSGEGLAIVLAAGSYSSSDDRQMVFPRNHSPRYLWLFGLGECRIDGALAISGLAGNGAKATLSGITAQDVSIRDCTEVACLGATTIMGHLVVPDGATLYMSADSYVRFNGASVTRLTHVASQVENGSGVTGGTVDDALDTLAQRTIKVLDMEPSDQGVSIVGPDKYIGAIGDVYDLTDAERAIVAGIQRLSRQISNPSVDTLTADRVEAEDVSATHVSTTSLTLGDRVVYIDEDGYLVVGAGAPIPGSSSSPSSPSGSSASHSGSSGSQGSSDSCSSSSSSSGCPSSSSAPGQSSSSGSGSEDDCYCATVTYYIHTTGELGSRVVCGEVGESVPFYPSSGGRVVMRHDPGRWVVEDWGGLEIDIFPENIVCGGSPEDSSSGSSSDSGSSHGLPVVDGYCATVTYRDLTTGHYFSRQVCGDWGETVTIFADNDGYIHVYRDPDEGGWHVTGKSDDIEVISIEGDSSGSSSGDSASSL